MKTAAVFAVIAMVLVAFCVMPVAAANADNDLYTSKYKATTMDYPTTGSISGAVRCHDNLLTKGVTVTDPNGIVTPVNLRDDGTFDLNDLAPGEYVINIVDGNGGQPESAKFTIRAGYVSFLESELLGHAADGSSEELDNIVVVNATYGMQRVVIDRPAVPGVPAVPATPDTYVYVGHNNGNYDSYTTCHHGGHGNNGQCTTVYVYVGCHRGDFNKIPGTPAIPAIPAIPAVTHIEGEFVDVTTEVQAVINDGAREFIFDNRPAIGGIFAADGVTLLQVIEDPAQGQIKSVVINVEINGVLTTINEMEYETITI
jgi:hypothetical protein